MIRIGYACINTQLPSPNRTVRLENVTPGRILELSEANLTALQAILEWNRDHGITLFRISSEIVPFGSHPVNMVRWWQAHKARLKDTGQFIRTNGMRVSMHPGQFTVLNSKRAEVVEASIAELVYHARLLDAMELDETHRLVLHLGGMYGDKVASLERFAANFARLPGSVQRRLALENDEKSYTLEDALAVSGQTSCPVIFDVFHHTWNPSFPGEPLRALVERAADTWQSADGPPKIHYSDQWQGKPPGSHSQSVDVEAFGRFYEQVRDLNLDVMLEVKDKEQSVLALYTRLPELLEPFPH